MKSKRDCRTHWPGTSTTCFLLRAESGLQRKGTRISNGSTSSTIGIKTRLVTARSVSAASRGPLGVFSRATESQVQDVVREASRCKKLLQLRPVLLPAAHRPVSTQPGPAHSRSSTWMLVSVVETMWGAVRVRMQVTRDTDT